MSDYEGENGSGDEWDDRHEKRKSWNPFSRRGARLSGAVDKKDIAESLRRQAKEEEEKERRRDSIAAGAKDESGSRTSSSRDRERRERERERERDRDRDDASRRKASLSSSGSRGSSSRGEPSPSSAPPAPSPGSNRGGSGVSFRAMREEKAEHERKESEREERDRRRIKLEEFDDNDDDRVNGDLRAARRSSVATTVDARRRKTSEKDVDALRAEKRRSERSSSRHKLDKPSAEDKLKAREEVEKKKRELERKKKEIEERIAKKKEEKEKEKKEKSDRPERSERSERSGSERPERAERSERSEREEREREREARLREREKRDKEEREREREEKERKDKEEKDQRESERQEKERERERLREREENERRERERKEREERREREERESREREERERKDKEEAERREREERERRAKEARDKDSAERTDDDLKPKKTIVNKRVPLERKESMVDSWAKKQMALLKEKKEKKEKEREDRDGARDSTSESEESSDEVTVRRSEVTLGAERMPSPSTTLSSERIPSTPTSPTAASAAAASAAMSGLTSSASMATKDKKKLERERKEIERKEKKKLEKELKEKAKEEKRKEKEKEKAERAKKGKDKEKKIPGLAVPSKSEDGSGGGGDELPHTPRKQGSQAIVKKSPAAASGAASTAVLKKPPTVGRSRGKGPSSRPSLLDSALSTAVLANNKGAAGGGAAAGGGGGAPKITRSAEEKSRMLGTQLIQMSVPNIKRKGPTFIPGFNPFPTNGPRYQKAETAAPAAAVVAPANGQAETKDVGKDAKGFARALLDFDRPKANPNLLLTRQTGWGRDARGTIREVPASRRGQLQSMKADRFWFSTINFAKARDEGVVKAKVDSLETQLSLKWDDFIASLPQVARPGHKKVRDGYDAAGVEKLENQGAAIVSALKLTAGTRGTDARDEAVPGGKKEVALPSYLRDFTGDEDESDTKRKHEDTRAKKYAVDMFLTANPNIAKDAQYDELFGECASEDPGLYIWRVEYFIPLEIDDDDYPDLKCKPPRPARFYAEDCYVILHITSMEKAKKFTIFTWMGAKACFLLHKQGTAAYRSRELNIFLNSKAMIVRETQYDESDDFMELFGWQIDYLEEGGTESAFKPTLPFSQEPRFYRLTFAPVPVDPADDPDAASQNSNAVGKRRRRYFSMRQVRLSALSLNSADVFVLDGGTDGYIFQWNGARSERSLQFKGHEICTRINRYERSCGSKIRVLEEGFEDAGRKEEGAEWRNFWDYMREPLEGPVPEKGPEVVDDILLCKTAVDPETGRPRLAVIRKGGETGPLSRRMLDSSAAVIMDAFTELFVWIGHGSSLLQRQIAKAAARRFRDEVNKEGRPSWTPINIIYEEFEPSAFIAKFADWCAELFAPLPSNYATAQMSHYRIAPTEPWPKISIDQVVNLMRPPQEPFVDEGGGSVEVWAIEDGKPTFTKLPAEERGHFYSGDCYLVLYTFYNPNDNMKQAYLCYFWEGRSSSNRWWPAFLFGFYPVLEKKILNYGGRPPVKIRISEHKEPPHFMKLFNGHIIIHKGHRKKRLTKPKPKALYHIRRTTEEITHTVQVKSVVSSLNSKDAFVLLTQDVLYLWYGKGTGFEDSTAILKVPDLLQGKRRLEVFDEGEEDPAFWNLLGGWSDYVCNQQFLQKYREKARLFCFSNQTGRFAVSEVYEFFQTDLNLANVYLLDTYHEVYVWLGKSASESQYKQVLEFANRYVREMATRRKIYVPLIATEDGEEQVEFTRHFHTWVTKPPFIDPAIGRDDRYADLMFQVYKRKEQEKAKEKELRLAQSKTKEPLRKIDWIEWIRKEIPELILSEGDFSDEEDEGEDGEYYDDDEGEEEEITFDQVGEREEGDEENNGEEEESSSDEEPAEEEDEEIVYGEFDAGEIEEKPKAVGKTAAEYLMEKVHKESKYFKMYHT